MVRQALAQLPGHRPGQRHGRKVLIRTDGAGGTKALIEWLTNRRLSYSVGFTLPSNTPDLLAKIPDRVWTSPYDAHDQVRDGAWVAELTGLLDLSSWPVGMRVIVRKERPHLGAQLRFDDVDGRRITAFVTNTSRGQLPTSSCVTGAAPAAKTGSGSPKTQAWSTCPCTATRRTRFGAPS